MKFLADESLDVPIVEELRHVGHEVQYVAEMSPGINDDSVLDLARREDALLLTADRDFGDLVFRQRRVTAGVVLVRLAGLSIPEKTTIVLKAVQAYEDQLPRAFTVISAGAVRVRRT